MKASDFEVTVAALWRKLEMGAPRIDQSKELILSIDGMNVVLTESPDGRRLLLSAKAGRLHDNSGVRAEQVRELLRKALGYLLVSRACISVQLAEDGGLTALVEASYPYERKAIDELVSVIHELVEVLEFVKHELVPIAPSAIISRSRSSDMIDNIIFKP